MAPNKSEIILVLLTFAVAWSSCGVPATILPIRKLVIDTDGVLDDIVSIIMALEAERLDNGPEIIAITCLNGVSYLSDATTNVLKTLKALNRTDIPVYAGASSPLLLPDKKDLSYGNDGFGDFEYPDPPSNDLVQKTHAVNALIDLVKKFPGEVTVITIAPLTNIALTVRMYSSFLEEVQQLIVMGGSVEGRGNVRPGIDYNSFVDPIANYIVFSSVKSKPISFIYLETTVRARTSMELRLSLNQFNNTKSWLIKNGERTALRPEAEYWYCPDAVGIVVATTSGSIVNKSATYWLDAIYDGKTQGMTLVDYTNITGNPANTNLIQDIDVNEYERLLLRYFS